MAWQGEWERSSTDRRTGGIISPSSFNPPCSVTWEIPDVLIVTEWQVSDGIYKTQETQAFRSSHVTCLGYIPASADWLGCYHPVCWSCRSLSVCLHVCNEWGPLHTSCWTGSLEVWEKTEGLTRCTCFHGLSLQGPIQVKIWKILFIWHRCIAIYSCLLFTVYHWPLTFPPGCHITQCGRRCCLILHFHHSGWSPRSLSSLNLYDMFLQP